MIQYIDWMQNFSLQAIPQSNKLRAITGNRNDHQRNLCQLSTSTHHQINEHHIALANGSMGCLTQKIFCSLKFFVEMCFQYRGPCRFKWNITGRTDLQRTCWSPKETLGWKRTGIPFTWLDLGLLRASPDRKCLRQSRLKLIWTAPSATTAALALYILLLS